MGKRWKYEQQQNRKQLDSSQGDDTRISEVKAVGCSINFRQLWYLKSPVPLTKIGPIGPVKHQVLECQLTSLVTESEAAL